MLKTESGETTKENMPKNGGCFRVVRPFMPPPQFHQPEFQGISLLQKELQIRECDRSSWAVMAWQKDCGAPYYLTPDGTFWLNGLDGQNWLHESFSLFQTRELAEKAIDSIRWGRVLESLGLAQVLISGSDICLVTAHEIDVESN